MQTLGNYLCHEDILLGVQASSQRELFEQVGAHLERVHGLAIPHARIKDGGTVRIIYVRLATAMQFKAQDGEPVSEVIVLIVPEPARHDHLQFLSELVTLLSDERFRQTLRACTQPQALKELMTHWTE